MKYSFKRRKNSTRKITMRSAKTTARLTQRNIFKNKVSAGQTSLHGMGGNDAYKVVPKYKKISKRNEITIHHVYLNRGVLRSPLNL